jgi:hypothetical protein
MTREQGTGNREQGTGNREQGTGDRCYATVTGNREQGTGNREQGTGKRFWKTLLFVNYVGFFRSPTCYLLILLINRLEINFRITS